MEWIFVAVFAVMVLATLFISGVFSKDEKLKSKPKSGGGYTEGEQDDKNGQWNLDEKLNND